MKWGERHKRISVDLAPLWIVKLLLYCQYSHPAYRLSWILKLMMRKLDINCIAVSILYDLSKVILNSSIYSGIFDQLKPNTGNDNFRTKQRLKYQICVRQFHKSRLRTVFIIKHESVLGRWCIFIEMFTKVHLFRLTDIISIKVARCCCDANSFSAVRIVIFTPLFWFITITCFFFFIIA